MATIEERADTYVGHPFEIDEFSSTSIKRQAFIDGAKEQREIDINKICDILSQLGIFELMSRTDEEGFRPCVHKEMFRKILEEEE